MATRRSSRRAAAPTLRRGVMSAVRGRMRRAAGLRRQRPDRFLVVLFWAVVVSLLLLFAISFVSR